MFTLHQNGTINHPRILHSSGTQSLDLAALEAVKRAAPFQHVEQYLKESRAYQIDVVFQLS
jgi:TonB family protein